MKYWGRIPAKPAILTDNQISWDEIQGDLLLNSIAIGGNPAQQTHISSGRMGFGSEFNLNFSPTAIEIPTNNIYGGYHDNHTGARLCVGDMWGWGSAAFKIYISSNWGEYNTIPCLSAGNQMLEIPGYFKGTGIEINLPTSLNGLPSGRFYRDSNGFVKVV